MKFDNMQQQHLNEEQLIQAMVDAADLSQSVQTHLAECNQCRAGINSFELEIAKLSQKAEQFTPKPQRRIILPVHRSKSPIWNLLDWRNLVAAATAVTAVFILVWGTNSVRDSPDHGKQNLTAEMIEAQRFMTEVNTLVDNALPPFYLEISGEQNADYDEEFYRFLIPPIEDRTLTSNGRKKGTSLC